MPIPPLVAIVLPIQLAPDLAAAALKACNLALGAGRCVVVSQERAPHQATWIARVGIESVNDNALTVELLASRATGGSATDSRYQRVLRFEPTDAPPQRWSTTGVVIAALTVSAESDEVAEDSAAHRSASSSDAVASANERHDSNNAVTAPAKTKTIHASSAPTGGVVTESARPERSTSALALDVAANAGPGIVGQRWRFGFHFRPQIEFDNYRAYLQLGGTWADDSLSASWLSAAAGVGTRVLGIGRRITVDARLAASASRVTLSAVDAAGKRDAASRYRYGIGLGLDAMLSLSPVLGLFIAADGTMADPAIKIRVANKQVGEYPTAELLIAGGVRWRIPITQ